MSFEAHLHRHDRVILFSYTDPITPVDIDAAFDKYRAIADKASAPIHTVSDLTRVMLLPPNLMSSVRSAKSPIRHRRAGQMLIVTHNMFISSLLSAVSRLIPEANIHTVQTMDQAWLRIDVILAQEAKS